LSIPVGRQFHRLTWTDVDRMPARERVVVILPLGSQEQHGPHLPLDTDTAIVEAVLANALARVDPTVRVFSLPTLPFGKSNEHLGFPGTVALSATTLLTVLAEITDGIYAAGFRRLLILNGHGGQQQVAEIAARDAHIRYPDLWVFVRFLWAAAAPATEPASVPDFHAGRDETSLLLAIRPEGVQTAVSVSEFPPEGAFLTDDTAPGAQPSGHRQVPIPFAWATRDLSVSGVIGDAKAASVERGYQLLAALEESLARQILAISTFNPDFSSGPG
jgi:creatinine amidohydrolase